MASYSGFWGGSAYTPLVGRNPLRKRVKQIMKTEGMRVVGELLDTTIGAAAGSAASKSYERIKQAPQGLNSGQREIETVTLINRNSTAADVTDLKKLIANPVAPTTYPVDGNKGEALA